MEQPEPRTRKLADILADLKKPPARKHLSTKKQGGSSITFMSWYYICDYLDLYAPGWEWEVEVTVGHERIFAVGHLTLHGSDGAITRHATGTEKLDKDGWGDPSSNAEAMCLRRAACKFGFCRDLWKRA